MTHRSGPRKKVLEKLEWELWTAIGCVRPQPTAGEIVHAAGHLMIDAMHTAMGPKLSDKLCPTCPKPKRKRR